MAKLTLDKALIRELTELLEETGLSEIEVEENGRRVRVARNALASPVNTPPAPSEAPSGDDSSLDRRSSGGGERKF